MSEDLKLEEIKKESYIDNPQDACDRQESRRALSGNFTMLLCIEYINNYII